MDVGEPARHGSTLSEIIDGFEPADDHERGDVDRIVRMLADGTEPWSRASALHCTASALVVDLDRRRVLLRWHARQQAWIQVGGHADAGEDDPLEIAMREAGEETGLRDLVPIADERPIHVVIVPVPANDSEPAHEHADIRYLLATSAAGDVRPESPGAELRWLSFVDAAALTKEANVRDTLARAERSLARHRRTTEHR